MGGQPIGVRMPGKGVKPQIRLAVPSKERDVKERIHCHVRREETPTRAGEQLAYANIPDS